MLGLPVLANVQLERVAAFPEKFSDNPLRAMTLSTIQRRNAALDAVFYDIAAITPEEAPALAFWLAREGAIVYVPPTGAGRLEVFTTVEAFLDEARPVAALALAGVGSSALGAAAFARNVADAVGGPVAAVVSGYGLADLMTEALGGFFWFGALNGIRHAFEPLDTATKLFTRSEQAETLSLLTRTSRDTETVVALLADPRFSPPLLVGHSKGNLVLSEALYALAREKPAIAQSLAARVRIATVSAKVAMPPPFKDVIDIIGGWDWFGALNSRPDIAAEVVVRGAWHSTNPAFPLGMGLRVTETLRRALTDVPPPLHTAAAPAEAANDGWTLEAAAADPAEETVTEEPTALPAAPSASTPGTRARRAIRAFTRRGRGSDE